MRSSKEKAHLDHGRRGISGIPEVILAQGKDPHDVADFLLALAKTNGFAFATKVEKSDFMKIKQRVRTKSYNLSYHQKARIALLVQRKVKMEEVCGPVGLVSAGTSDVHVAEEARVTLQILGVRVLYAYDVGIAGFHRIFPPLELMKKEKVSSIIVVAGREAALPTIVKALVDVPVIGVPASGSYGYGAGGTSSLMGILQSCSPGVVCVNIDNGFGAACAAFLIAKGRKDK